MSSRVSRIHSVSRAKTWNWTRTAIPARIRSRRASAPPLSAAPTNSITDQPVRGGYAMASYSLAASGNQRVIAFTRAQYFRGSFKTDADARSSIVHEYEPGVEWTIDEGFELTASYALSDR